jgi:plastocyanin
MDRSLTYTMLLALVALGMTTAFAAQMISVVQQHRAFAVKDIAVHVGDTVRFVNEDTFVHQIFVAAPNFTFESDEQPPGVNVDVRFTATGTFSVMCHIHPKMLLLVTVQ